MVKPTDKPEIITAPLMVKSVVSIKATVPLMPYGNIEMFSSQEFYTQSDQPDSVRDEIRANLLTSLRLQTVEQVLPLAEAEVLRCKSALVKDRFPEAWMQRNSSAYRWLRVAAPDMAIQAMQDILGNINIALD